MAPGPAATQPSYLRANIPRAILIGVVALVVISPSVYFFLIAPDWMKTEYPAVYPYRRTAFAIAFLVQYGLHNGLGKVFSAKPRKANVPHV